MQVRVYRRFGKQTEIKELHLEPETRLPVGQGNKKVIDIEPGEAVFIPNQTDIIPWTVALTSR